jgi:hypothetical protein
MLAGPVLSEPAHYALSLLVGKISELEEAGPQYRHIVAQPLDLVSGLRPQRWSFPTLQKISVRCPKPDHDVFEFILCQHVSGSFGNSYPAGAVCLQVELSDDALILNCSGRSSVRKVTYSSPTILALMNAHAIPHQLSRTAILLRTSTLLVLTRHPMVEEVPAAASSGSPSSSPSYKRTPPAFP